MEDSPQDLKDASKIRGQYFVDVVKHSQYVQMAEFREFFQQKLDALSQSSAFSYLDLSEQDLSGCDLSNFQFLHSDFTDAILTGANLNNTKLEGSILTGINLAGAMHCDPILRDLIQTRIDLLSQYTTNHASSGMTYKDVVQNSKERGQCFVDAIRFISWIQDSKIKASFLAIVQKLSEKSAFSYLDLRGQDLSGLDLSNLQMQRLMFDSHTNFTNTNLTNIYI